jgi:HJR/Mrr/RecB family endonuclease
MEQWNRREGYKKEWEKLRRAEIKRLSQARLSSSETYFAMEPRQFEDSVMRVFRKLGYKVNQTVYVADGGKDAIAWKGKKKYVIECKRYGTRSSTGRRDLQILLAAMHDVEADGAIFVTTGRLTTPAMTYAKDNDIECYDKDSFPNLINHAYGSDEDYSDLPPKNSTS